MKIMTTAVMVLLMGMATAPVMADAVEQGNSEQSASTQGERLSGSAIRDRVMGHRVTGAMVDGSQYSEAYRVDGTIEGKDYTGQSTIRGDQMCLDYGSGDTTCYQIRMLDDQHIEWLLDGEVVGEGTISSIQ
ncbi:hypothetical protein [Kushneria marisflavi]|nr:hypothetical protein [Kushneria marisflavi]RKD87592.1 hypothetical protein C8D96_1076 [Kushneria marisflavi]